MSKEHLPISDASVNGGELSKVAQTIPDWAARVFGKDLHAAKHKEKPGRGR